MLKVFGFLTKKQYIETQAFITTTRTTTCR
jgi:hypothetical protein